MNHYRITGPAKQDLGDIIDYLNAENPAAARRLVDRLLATFQQLADMPGMGRSQEHRQPGLRSWPVDSYLVFYRPAEDEIQIVRVIHGRRDLDRLF